MSVRLAHHLERHAGVSGLDLQVLLACARECATVNGEATCTVDVQKLASDHGTTARSVNRALARLVAGMSLRRVKRGRYVITATTTSSGRRGAGELAVASSDYKTTRSDTKRHEATPPRHLNPPLNGTLTTFESLSRRFTEIWNGNCAPLPRLRKPPTGRDAERLIRLAWDRSDGDELLLGRAVARAAANEHYRTNRYGWETFCRHIDRWLDDPTPVAVAQNGHASNLPYPTTNEHQRVVQQRVWVTLAARKDVDVRDWPDEDRPLVEAAIAAFRDRR